MYTRITLKAFIDNQKNFNVPSSKYWSNELLDLLIIRLKPFKTYYKQQKVLNEFVYTHF